MIAMLNFNIKDLCLRNHRITMLEHHETTIIQFLVDLYYRNIYIGYAVGRVSDDCSLELIDEFKLLRTEMYEWRGEEYTVELISKRNESGELVPATGEYHTDKEDISLWIEGQIAEWIKSNFY